MMNAIVLAVSVAAGSFVSADVLEPSVENEVMHSLSKAPSFVPAGGTLATGAVELVSMQKSDGRFFDGTNDVTFAAVRTLRKIVGVPGPELKISIFASHVESIASEQGIAFDDALGRVAALGYRGVDVYEGTPADRLQAIRRNGMEIPCVIGTPRFESTYDEDWAEGLVAYAAANRIPRIMLVPGFFTKDGDRDAELELIAGRTERFARTALASGIETMVEDYDSPESPTRDSGLLRRFFAFAPSVKLVFDTGNFAFAGESPLAADSEFSCRIAHYHLKDRPGEGTWSSVPVGSGIVPMCELLSRAIDRGYGGWFTVEHFGVSDMLSAAGESIGYLR